MPIWHHLPPSPASGTGFRHRPTSPTTVVFSRRPLHGTSLPDATLRARRPPDAGLMRRNRVRHLTPFLISVTCRIDARWGQARPSAEFPATLPTTPGSPVRTLPRPATHGGTHMRV